MIRSNRNISAAPQRNNERSKAVRHKVQQQIRELEGIIPICSYCHQIRIDKHTWLNPEEYIIRHTKAQYSHGICPACIPRVLEEYGLENSEPN